MPRETIMCGENGVEHVWMRGAEFCRCGAERLTNDVDDVDDTDDEIAVRCPWGHWNHVFTRDRTFCLCGAERRPDAVCDGDEHVWFCDDETCECGDVTNLRHHPQFDPPVPTQIEADDPDFDGDRRFPRLTEDRDGTIWSVPFRNSQMYRHDCRQWSDRPPADVLADLRRLLPRLRAVRSVSTAKQQQHHQWLQDLNKGILRESSWDEEVELLRFVRADERWQPRFWRELKRHDPKLIVQIERACRQERNKLAGRKRGKQLTALPTPAEQQQMRALAAELHPKVCAAKRTWRNGRKGQALHHLQEIANSVKPELSKQLRQCGIFEDQTHVVHVDEKPQDIVIWLVAKKFHVSLPRTKAVLARRSDH